MDETSTAFPGYKSPWRNLAWSFRQSRDKWKRKCQDLQRVHKRLQNEVRDVRKSRAVWQGRAIQALQQAATLGTEVQHLQEQLHAVRAAAEKRG